MQHRDTGGKYKKHPHDKAPMPSKTCTNCGASLETDDDSGHMCGMEK